MSASTPSRAPSPPLPSAAPRARPVSQSLPDARDVHRGERVGALASPSHGCAALSEASSNVRPLPSSTRPRAASEVTMTEPARILADVPTWVLLHVEATARGFRNALSFRRWCRRHGVPIRMDGRKQWVAPRDVDAAIATIPTSAAPAPEEPQASTADPVASGVLDLMHRVRRSR